MEFSSNAIVICCYKFLLDLFIDDMSAFIGFPSYHPINTISAYLLNGQSSLLCCVLYPASFWLCFVDACREILEFCCSASSMYMWAGCPLQPGKPECNVRGNFAVLSWTKAAVLAGDPPVMLYIVQAKELSTSMPSTLLMLSSYLFFSNGPVVWWPNGIGVSLRLLCIEPGWFWDGWLSLGVQATWLCSMSGFVSFCILT